MAQSDAHSTGDQEVVGLISAGSGISTGNPLRGLNLPR